jgi:hypothetical protein
LLRGEVDGRNGLLDFDRLLQLADLEGEVDVDMLPDY